MVKRVSTFCSAYKRARGPSQVVFIFCLLIASLLFFTGVNNVAGAPIPSDFVAYWKFEGNANDETERNNGTEYGNPGYVAGVNRNAINFDGVNGVKVADSSSLDIEHEISLVAWVKYDDYYNHGKIIIKPYNATVNEDPWELYSLDLKWRDPNWVPHFLISDGVPGGLEGAFDDTYDISLDQWYHIVGTYDGSLMKLYVNAGLIAVNPVSLTIGTNDEPLFIGGVEGFPFTTTGSIDEVMIFDRALSADEVLALYNKGVTYTIAATAGQGGTIAPAGFVQVNEGDSQTFTITAEAGYHIADVLVDGISQGALTGYTFSDVIANHTIEPSFAINTYTLIITAVNGSVTKTPDQPEYEHGTPVTLQAIADSGYHFLNWSGALSGNENPVTITIDSDISITANFAIVGRQFGDVSKVIPYPNPFRIKEAKNNTLKFINLPDEVVLQIFNIFGEMIYKEEYTATGGRVEWDGNNNSGRPVVTGLYIYLITDKQGHKKTGRISVIR